MNCRYLLLFSFLLSLAALGAEAGLIASIEKQVVRRNRDGKATTWFHPRACRLPGKADAPRALMTVQSIGGSDYFGPVHWSESKDLGKTWAKFRPIPALDRVPVAEHPGLMAGVCDVVPQYHSQTKTILALGHVVFYKGPKFARGDQLARYPVYTVRRADGTWSKRRILEWNDPRGAFIYSNNCGQRVVLPNGDILLAFTFGDKPTHRSVAGVLCAFDGESLRIKKVGPPLKLAHKRGLLEPSVTQFGGKFYITIRAEDDHGYQSVSADGLNWASKQRWVWDNGDPINMSTTQQHWLTHSDGLFLVYTRKDKSNTGIIRWRAPLYVARVDVRTRRLIKSTERVVLPLMGDGVKDPDNVALMGNFNITNAGPNESWVTVGEWMPRKNARGDLLLGRIRWSRPNRLAK